jgi:phage tail-like protein
MAIVAQRQDPLLGYNFLVSFMDSQPSSGAALGGIALSLTGGQASAGFQEISGLEVTMEVENYEAGGVNTGALRFPGRMKWANLVFKRGVVSTSTFLDPSDSWTWLTTWLNGQGIRKDGTVTLLDESGSAQMVWSWQRGLPARWTGPTMNAQQSQIAIESLEIAHEGLTVTTGGPIGVLAVGIAGAIGSVF